jgi:hypothetical protein
MRDDNGYITCAVATANGFAMPYRASPASQPDAGKAPKKDRAAPAGPRSHAAKLAADSDKEKS